jgi:SAM-dependent methyltransferase
LRSSEDELIFRSRRRPRATQFDYLHLKILLQDVADVFARTIKPDDEVLDVYCGTRPYDDLLPPGATCLGFDIDDRHGVADVVSRAFLPFADASFDVVVSLEAFHYVSDPTRGVDELRRVLRPGGRVVIAVPLVWEYDRHSVEHRYTETTLAALFSGWRDVEVRQNGGRAVAWATLSGRIVDIARERLTRRLGFPWVWRTIAAGSYLAINTVAWMLERHGRFDADRYVLPMNLMLTARHPAK